MLRYFFGVILTAIAKCLMAMADISDEVFTLLWVVRNEAAQCIHRTKILLHVPR